MSLTLDIPWSCPNCSSEQTAQLWGDEDDYQDKYTFDAIPCDRGLKWNPPCEKCGKYRLVEPKGNDCVEGKTRFVSYVIDKVKYDEDGVDIYEIERDY